jgi:nucleoside-diphosphate-sugar epimerase
MRTLAAEPLDLIIDPEPDGPPTALRTSIKAWSSIPAGSTHHLVLEDDAVPSAGFMRQVERAAAAAPDAAIAFYTNWQSRNGAAVRLGVLCGARWTVAVEEYSPTVALLMPSSVGRAFPAYARRAGDAWPDDIVMARYLRDSGVPTYLTVPNLVEQAAVPSTLEYDLDMLSRATCFSALPAAADWSIERMLVPDIVPVFECNVAQCLVRDDNGGGWRQVGAARGFSRLRLDMDECLGMLERRAKVSPGLIAAVDGLLSPAALREFWKVAFLLGGVGRRADEAAGSAAARNPLDLGPLVLEALGTLGLAAVCVGLTMGELSRVRDPMRELAVAAVEAGARLYAAPHGAAARSGHSPPVTRPALKVAITGGDQPLARYLAADMADRGHQVVAPGLRGTRIAGSTEACASDEALTGADVLIHLNDPRFEAPSPAPVTRRDGAGNGGPASVVWQLLEQGRRDGIRHVVYLDVGAAGSARLGFRDEDLPHPVNGDPVLTVLRVAVPYGPEMVGYSPLNDFIWSMLVRQPVRADSSLWRPFQLVHVWDVAEIVARVALPQRRSTVLDVCATGPLTAGQLADCIAGSISRTQVQDAAREMARKSPNVLSSKRTRESTTWSPVIDLADGIGTLALWLLYHADHM